MDGSFLGPRVPKSLRNVQQVFEEVRARRMAETETLWPTFAGIGLLFVMLLAVCFIGYCLQAGRRRRERQKLDRAQDISIEAKEEKQLDPAMTSLASLSTRPSSSCSRPPSRPNSAWSKQSEREFRPTSAPHELPRSRQVRTVLEAEVLENEDFEWARPIGCDVSKGRFTVEDLCTVYLASGTRTRPSTSPTPWRTPAPPPELPGFAELDMQELQEATAAAIAVAEERESLQVPRSEARSRQLEDVPYKEVWANTAQSNLLFEVWRSPDLVKEWQLPPSKLGRRKKPQLTRAWTVGTDLLSEMDGAQRGKKPLRRTRPGRPSVTSAERSDRFEASTSSWFSDGQFVRPATLKARSPAPPKTPLRPMSPPSPSSRFQKRAATAAAWVFGRRQQRGDAQPEDNDEDVEKLTELLVSEMQQQLQHTSGEPLQVRKLIFRDLQRQLHPDKNTHCEEAAKHAFQKLMQERQSYLKP
mmetsp:Transcript_53481/g.116806  ORF Transcript_53481/g.116806 Transcript_53481/m.116806 type:complete len:471 (-) Transcript_53481:75-1487(-)